MNRISPEHLLADRPPRFGRHTPRAADEENRPGRPAQPARPQPDTRRPIPAPDKPDTRKPQPVPNR